MNKTEIKTITLLALIYVTRMLGLFIIFPTFSLLAKDLDFSTPATIGLAFGMYGAAQACLQIPAGILSDIVGRKKILYLGLGLFLTGSILAALSTNIYVMMLARLMQGMGAVSSTCLAYIADSIRGHHHGKAMTIIGLSIALSFVLSFLLGPVISHYFGLSGIFLATASMVLIAMVAVYFLPNPEQTLTVFNVSEFIQAAKDRHLLMVNFQIGLLHMTLAASFFIIPHILHDYLPEYSMVWLYVTPIAAAFILVMPFIRKNRDKAVTQLPYFWGGLTLAIIGFAFMAVAKAWFFMLILCFFFFCFTFIEAMLPSRLFQLAKKTSRGATSGIFSVYQYLGTFTGAIIGSQLYQYFLEYDNIPHSFFILAIITAAVAFMVGKPATKQSG